MATKKSSGPKIVPLGDRVIVQVTGTHIAKTKSGIYIPETVKKEKPEQGTVVAVGPGHYENGKLVPIGVKVGDTIMFSKYGYEEVKIDDEDFLVIKEEHILAIIK
jgi:chaperonin GroES